MCFEETCVPYCARNVNDPICKDWVKEMTSTPKANTVEETGEVCVNVEYDIHVPSGSNLYCGEFNCTDVPYPAHDVRTEKNLCVDVYENDLNDATNRMNSLLTEKKAKEGWTNDKYYCMYGATEFLMSIFQPTSLEYSNKYCGRVTEETRAEPAAKEETGFSLWDAVNRSFEMQRETREIFREQCDAGNWVGCFDLASMSNKL